jgi:hypothetical protein
LEDGTSKPMRLISTPEIQKACIVALTAPATSREVSSRSPGCGV